jgi:hypothetical protein
MLNMKNIRASRAENGARNWGKPFIKVDIPRTNSTMTNINKNSAFIITTYRPYTISL